MLPGKASKKYNAVWMQNVDQESSKKWTSQSIHNIKKHYYCKISVVGNLTKYYLRKQFLHVYNFYMKCPIVGIVLKHVCIIAFKMR